MTTALDCEHGHGPAAIAAQRRLARTVAALWHGELAELPSASSIDALFTREGVLLSIAEIKVRAMTWRELVALGSLVITFDKLQRGRALARALAVPFDVFAGLADGAIVWFRVADATGAWALTPPRIARTVTAKSCNGGTATRANAYLDVRAARLLRPPSRCAIITLERTTP